MRINSKTDDIGPGWKPLVRTLNQVLIGIDERAEVIECDSYTGRLNYQYAFFSEPSRTERDLFEKFLAGVKEVALGICELCGEVGYYGAPVVALDGETFQDHTSVLCYSHRTDQINRIKESRVYA